MEEKKNQPTNPQESNRSNRENTTGSGDREKAVKAHDQAEKDINNDAELSAHSPNDDLDEGETARLGEGKNPLI